MKRSSTTMTPAKGQKSKTSRTQYKKNSKRKPVTNSFVDLGPQPGFPTRLMCRHKYAGSATLSSAAGAAAAAFFRANGLFDPDVAIGGHQPMYFDQLCEIYNHWVVVGSRIKVTFAPTSTNYPMLASLYLNDDSSGTNPVYNSMEEMNAKGVLLATAGGGTKTLTCNYSAKGTFGGTVLSNTSLQGTSSADPTEQSVFTVEVQTADLTNTSACVILYEIEYTAVWFELKDLTSS